MRCALLALFALLACAPACTEVRKCQRGDPGCLAGPPEDGRCQPGLVVKHGACTEPGAGPAALECGCGAGEICTLDGYACVDYCAPLDVSIGSAPPRAQYACDPSLSV